MFSWEADAHERNGRLTGLLSASPVMTKSWEPLARVLRECANASHDERMGACSRLRFNTVRCAYIKRDQREFSIILEENSFPFTKLIIHGSITPPSWGMRRIAKIHRRECGYHLYTRLYTCVWKLRREWIFRGRTQIVLARVNCHARPH